MPLPGSISAKAGASLKAKLAVLRKTRAQGTRMASFDGKSKDEGSAHKRAEIPNREINHPTNQDKGGKYGTPSKGGRTGAERQPLHKNQIDAKSLQGKKWVPGSKVSASNPATGNTRMKGKIAARGGQYGGGSRSTQ